MTDDRARRQEYARTWLAAYRGTEPLFVAIRTVVKAEPDWELPPAVVTAVVRFSADETWKSDRALEQAVVKALAGHHPGPSNSSRLATTVAQRSQVRRAALDRQNRSRGRRRR